MNVASLLQSGNKEALQTQLAELQPYDLTTAYIGTQGPLRSAFINALTPWQLTSLAQELEFEEQLELLDLVGVERSADVLDKMENDDLADLLAKLPQEQLQGFLGNMQREESIHVQSLLQYPPESAGGIMTNRYVWVRASDTVMEAVDKIKKFAEYAQNIYYLYILDEHKKLVGVASYRDLVLAGPEERMSDIMHERVISVPVHMDQEEVARTMARYDFIAIPVTDEQERLLGMITVDDILDVLVEEADEDIHKLNATGKRIDFRTGAWTATLRRLPWLILLLLLGFVSGGVISLFESTLEQVVALTFFMPMIAGMTGNTGTQSLAIVVRGLTIDSLERSTVVKLISREFRVGLMIGLTCGVAVAVITYFWQSNLPLSLVIGCSLLLTLVIGTLAGTVIPILLYTLKVDPAVASGPLITTLNDVFSLMVYFGLATLFISQL